MPLGVNSIPAGYLLLAVGVESNGINLTMQEDVDIVLTDGKATIAKTYSGEWWRGNELGGIVNNPDFWSGTGIWPMSNMLGSTIKQHAAVRKHFEKVFAPPENSTWIRESLKEFLKARADAGKLVVKTDLQKWMYQVSYKNVFGRSIDYAKAEEFVTVQDGLVSLGTVSQAISGPLYGIVGGDLGIPSVRDGVAKHVREYLPMVEELWGEELEKFDCSPTPNCSLQLASGLWDAFYSAGGLSVPTALQSGLAIMFSTDSSNPSPNYTIPKGEELNFFWECIRYIPPVYGFPHWEVSRPVCTGLTAEETQALNKSHGETLACPKPPVNPQTGYPPVNQWLGGHRVVLQLAAVQKSPKIWGEGANTSFKVRPLQDYEKKSVGFAEMAVDDSIDDGRNNRVCPGRDLALLIGKIFWEEFDVSAWEAEKPAIAIHPDAALVQIPGFIIRPKASAS